MDQRLKCKTVKLLEGKIRENLQHQELDEAFLGMTPHAKSIKGKIDKLYVNKIKILCSEKDLVKEM